MAVTTGTFTPPRNGQETKIIGISSSQTSARNKSKSAKATIPTLEVIKLWTKAGGRCEFLGCNKYLWLDSLTLKEANFGQNAHVIAKRLNGPRGNGQLPLKERNKADNLILLCMDHHHLIDSKEHRNEYTDSILYQYKKDHESRIKYYTGLNGTRTHLVRVRSKIAGEAVEISDPQIREAVLPLYPLDDNGTEIDLTALPDLEDENYWEMGKRIIDQGIREVYRPAVGKNPIDHLSVFALGSIPLLVYFGYKLSNKIQTQLFQRHRDTEDWKWKHDCDIINFELKCLQEKASEEVSLILSLSGKIRLEDLPDEIRSNHTVYEITVADIDPNPRLFGRLESLGNFQRIYQMFLRFIKTKHGAVKSISLFPAIPAPMAVVCGRDLLKKVDPSLIVFDNNKNQGGFRFILKVN